MNKSFLLVLIIFSKQSYCSEVKKAAEIDSRSCLPQLILVHPSDLTLLNMRTLGTENSLTSSLTEEDEKEAYSIKNEVKDTILVLDVLKYDKSFLRQVLLDYKETQSMKLTACFIKIGKKVIISSNRISDTENLGIIDNSNGLLISNNQEYDILRKTLTLVHDKKAVLS